MGNCCSTSSNTSSSTQNIIIEEKILQNFNVDSPQNITVNTFNGSLNIESHEKNLVSIEVIKFTNENLKNITCNIEQKQSNNIILIEAVKSSKTNNSSSGARVSMRVPSNSILLLDTSNGKITTKGIFTSVNAVTSNGAITLDGSINNIDVSTSCGAITVTSNIPTKIKAETSNGAINFTGLLLANFSHILTSSNGSIKCTLPSSQKANIQASTSNGHISTDFNVLVGTTKPFSNNYLSGTINGGGNTKLILNTSNGNIKIFT